MPTWENDSELQERFHFVFNNNEETKLYSIKYGYNVDGTIEAFDLAGNLLSTTSLPTFASRSLSYRGHRLIALANNDFYLNAPFTSQLVYFNTDTSELWGGINSNLLSDADDIRVLGSVTDNNDNLIFWGSVLREFDTDNQSSDSAIGMINTDGELVKLVEYPNFSRIAEMVKGQDDRYFLRGVHTPTAQNDTGETYTYIGLDENLEQTHQFFYSNNEPLIAMLANNLLMEQDILGVYYQIVDPDGNLIANEIRIPYGSENYIATTSTGHFYSLEFVTDTNDGFEIAYLGYYDELANLIWYDSFKLKVPNTYADVFQVNEDDHLEMSIDAYGLNINGIAAGLAVENGDVLFGLNLLGQDVSHIYHYIYNPEGERVFYAKENSFVRRGKIAIAGSCFVTFVCIDETIDVEPGVCDLKDSTFLSNHSVFTASEYCESHPESSVGSRVSLSSK